jgi:hypothetical protein
VVIKRPKLGYWMTGSDEELLMIMKTGRAGGALAQGREVSGWWAGGKGLNLADDRT